MRLLIDTHAILWWAADDARLSAPAQKLMGGGHNELIWSMASSWEIAVKLATGKLELGRPVQRFFADLLAEHGMEILPIDHEHCVRLAELPQHHRDPFDRMLVVQAQQARIPILSADRQFAKYDVEVIW